MMSTSQEHKFDHKSTAARQQSVIRVLAREFGLTEGHVENRILLAYPLYYKRLYEGGLAEVTEELIGYTAEKRVWEQILAENNKSLEVRPFDYSVDFVKSTATPLCTGYAVYRAQRMQAEEARRARESKDQGKQNAKNANSLPKDEHDEEVAIKRDPSED